MCEGILYHTQGAKTQIRRFHRDLNNQALATGVFLSYFLCAAISVSMS